MEFKLKMRVSAPKDVEDTLLKMFGLDNTLVESLVIECYPGELPTATARIYATALPGGTPSIDEMVASAKVRLKKVIDRSVTNAHTNTEADFAELRDQLNFAVDNHKYVSANLLQRLDKVIRMIYDNGGASYYPSYAFGTPPSANGEYRTIQKKY